MPPELDEGPPLPPEEWTLPWVQLGAWIAAAFVVAWALVLMPGVVRDLQVYASDAGEDQTMPAMPDDPVLSPKVQDLMVRGKSAERDGRLAEARKYYAQAAKEERKCFSCLLRKNVVERLIREESVEALEAGAKAFEELRFEDAALQYRTVIGLVPDKKASYHVLAADGLQKAKTAAKQSGRPIP